MDRTRSEVKILSSILISLLLIISCTGAADISETGYEQVKEKEVTTFVIRIHKIEQLDDIDPMTAADWYYLLEVSDDGGNTWSTEYSPEPLPGSGDIMIVDREHSFNVSHDKILFRISLMEDDGDTGDDSADISARAGGGVDDSVPPPEGAVYHGIFWLNNHTVEGDLAITNEIGWLKSSGEWDGSSGVDENDAILWFDIFEKGRPAIERPIFTIPKIEEKGGDIDITASSEGANISSNWKVDIWKRYGNYMESFTLPIEGVYPISSSRWRISCHIPADAREGLYNLTVHNDFGSDMEYHAVEVIEELDKEFSFLHMTDVHIGSTSGSGATSYFSKAVKEVNLINPDFLIITGDVADKQYWTFEQDPPRIEQDQVFRQMLMELRVPVYVCSGNHDWSYDDTNDHKQNIESYKRWINPYHNFSFDYGGYHFALINSGKYVGLTNSDGLLNSRNLTWLENDLANNTDKIQLFTGMHHPAYPDTIDNDTVRDNFRQMVTDYNISMILTGHTHGPSVYDRNGVEQTGDIGDPPRPLHVTTPDMKDGDSFRLIRVKDEDIETYTYDTNNDGIRHANAAIPLGRIGADYNPSNDGSNTKVVAHITNGLHEHFSNAFVNFTVPNPPAGQDYIIENGTMRDMIDCGDKRIFYAQTFIKKNSSKRVTIKLADSEDIYLKHKDESDGWIFISTKLVPKDTSLTHILEHPVYGITGYYDKVMFYDHYKDGWRTYEHNRSSVFNDLYSWNESMGIWIHLLDETNLTVTGSTPTNTTIKLTPGWNMVGYPSNTTGNNGLPAEVDKIGYYDPRNKYNLEYYHDPSVFAFEPNEGYWVHNPTDVTLHWKVNY